MIDWELKNAKLTCKLSRKSHPHRGYGNKVSNCLYHYGWVDQQVSIVDAGNTMPTPLATLYDRADEFLKLAPWEWMDEIELVALRHPALPETAYLSVMGASGEHRSMAVYLGEEALHRFNRVQSSGLRGMELHPDDTFALIMESRQLQVSFSSRGDLEKHDLDQIKSLGRKYRGKVWPQFRSMSPGRAAGPLADLEIEVLTDAIKQILNVAPRLNDETVTPGRESPRHQILGREPGEDDQWRDFWHDFDDRTYQFPTQVCDAELAREVSRLSEEVDVQVAFNLIPTPIGPRFGEQTYPYLLMVVESESGLVMGVNVLSTESLPYAEMMATVPNELLRILKGVGAKPVCIRTYSSRTGALLADLAKKLNIPVSIEEELPELMEAMGELQSVMMGGPR